MTGFELYSGTLEGVAVATGEFVLRRCPEHALDVAEERLEHRTVLGIEALGVLQFLVQVVQGVLQFAHGRTRG